MKSRDIFEWSELSVEWINKHQRIPKGQSKMDNPEKLAKQNTTIQKTNNDNANKT